MNVKKQFTLYKTIRSIKLEMVLTIIGSMVLLLLLGYVRNDYNSIINFGLPIFSIPILLHISILYAHLKNLPKFISVEEDIISIEFNDQRKNMCFNFSNIRKVCLVKTPNNYKKNSPFLLWDNIAYTKIILNNGTEVLLSNYEDESYVHKIFVSMEIETELSYYPII